MMLAIGPFFAGDVRQEGIPGGDGCSMTVASCVADVDVLKSLWPESHTDAATEPSTHWYTDKLKLNDGNGPTEYYRSSLYGAPATDVALAPRTARLVKTILSCGDLLRDDRLRCPSTAANICKCIGQGVRSCYLQSRHRARLAVTAWLKREPACCCPMLCLYD
eukprot:5061517-Amphidinium_carterae.1